MTTGRIKRESMQRFNVYLTVKDIKYLQQQAKKEGTSASEMLRSIIRSERHRADEANPR